MYPCGHPRTEENTTSRRKCRECHRIRCRAFKKGSRQRRRKARHSALVQYDPCSYCGARGEQNDHIVPIAAGGENKWTNITRTCERCNLRKLDTPLLLFLLGR